MTSGPMPSPGRVAKRRALLVESLMTGSCSIKLVRPQMERPKSGWRLRHGDFEIMFTRADADENPHLDNNRPWFHGSVLVWLQCLGHWWNGIRLSRLQGSGNSFDLRHLLGRRLPGGRGAGEIRSLSNLLGNRPKQFCSSTRGERNACPVHLDLPILFGAGAKTKGHADPRLLPAMPRRRSGDHESCLRSLRRERRMERNLSFRQEPEGLDSRPFPIVDSEEALRIDDALRACLRRGTP